MARITSVKSDIRTLGNKLGLEYGLSYTMRFDRDEAELEVVGSNWEEQPRGSLSDAAHVFCDYLMSQPDLGWEFTEADGSGVYFRRRGFSVRFV